MSDDVYSDPLFLVLHASYIDWFKWSGRGRIWKDIQTISPALHLWRKYIFIHYFSIATITSCSTLNSELRWRDWSASCSHPIWIISKTPTSFLSVANRLELFLHHLLPCLRGVSSKTFTLDTTYLATDAKVCISFIDSAEHSSKTVATVQPH